MVVKIMEAKGDCVVIKCKCSNGNVIMDEVVWCSNDVVLVQQYGNHAIAIMV
jgi:hypothetical protein